jgi:hypothetical protein
MASRGCKPIVENIDLIRIVLSACADRFGRRELTDQLAAELHALCDEIESLYQAAPTFGGRADAVKGPIARRTAAAVREPNPSEESDD